MLELGKTEVSDDPANNSSGTPNITALSSQVPAGRVEQLRSEVDHGNLGNVVSSATDTSAESAEADGRGLCDDGVGDGTEGAGEDKGDDYSEDGLGVVCGVGLMDGSDDAEDHEEHNVGGCAPEVDCAAAEPGGQRPGEAVGDELEAGVDEIQLEGLVGVDTSLCFMLANCFEGNV